MGDGLLVFIIVGPVLLGALFFVGHGLTKDGPDGPLGKGSKPW